MKTLGKGCFGTVHLVQPLGPSIEDTQDAVENLGFRTSECREMRRLLRVGHSGLGKMSSAHMVSALGLWSYVQLENPKH